MSNSTMVMTATDVVRRCEGVDAGEGGEKDNEGL